MLTNLQSFANFFTFTKYILNEKLSDAHIMYLKSFEPPLFFGNQYMDFHMRGTAQLSPIIQNTLIKKMKFSIKDFFSKCDQILSFLRIWSHLLKKSLMEN